MRTQEMTEAIKMSLTAEQADMRDKLLLKEPGYWEERWENDRDGVCKDLMTLYMVTGKETQELMKKLAAETHQELKELIESISSEVKSLQHNDRRQDSRLQQLEHQGTNMALEIKHIASNTENIPRQISNMAETINAVHDTLNTVIKSTSVAQEPKKSAVVAFAGVVPPAAWVALILSSVFLATLYTGHVGDLVDIVEAYQSKD